MFRWAAWSDGRHGPRLPMWPKWPNDWADSPCQNWRVDLRFAPIWARAFLWPNRRRLSCLGGRRCSRNNPVLELTLSRLEPWVCPLCGGSCACAAGCTIRPGRCWGSPAPWAAAPCRSSATPRMLPSRSLLPRPAARRAIRRRRQVKILPAKIRRARRLRPASRARAQVPPRSRMAARRRDDFGGRRCGEFREKLRCRQ